MELFTFSPFVVAIVPVTIGLVQVVKSFFADRYVPLLAIVIGIALTALTMQSWQATVAQGIIAGLAASGLYSGARATVA
jgi:Na+/phosphate symporter